MLISVSLSHVFSVKAVTWLLLITTVTFALRPTLLLPFDTSGNSLASGQMTTWSVFTPNTHCRVYKNFCYCFNHCSCISVVEWFSSVVFPSGDEKCHLNCEALNCVAPVVFINKTHVVLSVMSSVHVPQNFGRAQIVPHRFVRVALIQVLVIFPAFGFLPLLLILYWLFFNTSILEFHTLWFKIFSCLRQQSKWVLSGVTVRSLLFFVKWLRSGTILCTN